MDTVFVALRVLVSLGAVVALLWYLQRRITKGTRSTRASKLVTVVTRQGLAQKASVVVIDVEGKRFLLGVTEHSVTVLDSSALPEPAPVAEEAPVSSIGERAVAFGSALAAVKLVPAKPASKQALPVAARMSLPQFDARTGLPKRPGAFDSSLSGSILSPETWRRTAAALRNRK